MDMPRVSAKERLILELLSGGKELYGLEMVAASRGALQRGSVYLALDRMQDIGLVESRGEDADGRTDLVRRVYRLTGYGARVLSGVEMARDVWIGLPS